MLLNDQPSPKSSSQSYPVTFSPQNQYKSFLLNAQAILISSLYSYSNSSHSKFAAIQTFIHHIKILQPFDHPFIFIFKLNRVHIQGRGDIYLIFLIFEKTLRSSIVTHCNPIQFLKDHLGECFDLQWFVYSFLLYLNKIIQNTYCISNKLWFRQVLSHTQH